MLRNWKDAGPLYLVNAEKFKRNLQSDPLIFDFFLVGGQCLKRELLNNVQQRGG